MSILKVKENLNKNIFTTVHSEKVFSMLLASKPFSLDLADKQRLQSNYNKIIEFFSITNGLINQALFGSGNEKLFDLFFLGRSDRGKRVEEHKKVYSAISNPLPLWFRTDEPVPGKIVEIQCPGSGLAQIGEVEKVWSQVDPRYQWTDWKKNVIDDIKTACSVKHPKIAYLEKSLNPQDTKLYIANLKKAGANIMPFNKTSKTAPKCDFFKCHNYFSLRKLPFYKNLLDKYCEHKIIVDVPPVLIYSMKLILALPFHDLTRDYYTDNIRNLFPETNIIQRGGKIHVDGIVLDYDDYCELPDKKRQHIIKLADGRGKMADGGKTVFSLSRIRKNVCRKLLNKALTDYKDHRPWIIQPDISRHYDYEYLDNDNQIKKETGYAKFSGFYGSSGLITTQVLYKNYYKVSGSKNSACAPISLK